MSSSSARSGGRADLFTPRTALPLPTGPAAEEKGGQEIGAGEDLGSPLQLEHILGSSGAYRRAVQAIPGGSHFAKAVGSLVVVESLSDPHDQRLLRGHDNVVCALEVSGSGALLASGQLGTEKYRGRAAPVFVWDTATGKRLHALRGLTTRVNAIAFSFDERFLCGCGEDCLLSVWDLSTGETIMCQRLNNAPTVLRWVDQYKQHQYTAYELVLDQGVTVMAARLQYDPSRVQWGLKLTPYAVPSGGGLVRSFTSLETSADRAFVFLGTSAGEVMVFKRDAAVFRACIPVCHNGVQAMAVLPTTGAVVCGGGDGSLKIIAGEDMSWELVLETSLPAGDGQIRSLSVRDRDATELVVACSSGTVLRCLSETFAHSVVGHGHTAPISALVFSASSTTFATGTKSGNLRVWDVSDYACLASTTASGSPGSVAAVTSLCLADGDRLLISGWDDGFVRCHDVPSLSRQMWSIPSAHRGGVRTIASHSDASLQYFVTGGADGAIRVWRLSTRELVTQYTEHLKGVSRVLVDVKTPNIVHSVGVDCTVLSYDLRAARRIICHLVSTGGTMTDMTQRKDGENELVTCDTQARLLHWDVDARDPVVAVQDPSMAALRCVVMSPSGRFLAFAGDDEVVKVLDMERGQIVALGQGHCGAVVALTWTPDERQLVSGGDDSSVCVWNFYLA